MAADRAAPFPEGDKDGTYNRVFEFYADKTGGEIDLVGLVAYSLHKRQKRDWLVSYRAENKGSPPSRLETSALTGSYMTSDARRTYRERAANLLNGYAEAFVEARTPTIREQALNNETLRQVESIRLSIIGKSGFWPSIGSGIVATAL